MSGVGHIYTYQELFLCLHSMQVQGRDFHQPSHWSSYTVFCNGTLKCARGKWGDYSVVVTSRNGGGKEALIPSLSRCDDIIEMTFFQSERHHKDGAMEKGRRSWRQFPVVLVKKNIPLPGGSGIAKTESDLRRAL